MTQRSIKVGIRGEEGRARAEAWAMLDYDAAHPPEGGPAKARGFTASSLPLLDCACIKKCSLWVALNYDHPLHLLMGPQLILTTSGQSGPESNSNEEVLHIPQILRTGFSLSDAV